MSSSSSSARKEAETGTSEYLESASPGSGGPGGRATPPAAGLGVPGRHDARHRSASRRHDVPGAAESFRRVLDRDPKEIDNSPRAGQASQADRPDLPAGGPTRRGPRRVAVDPGPAGRPGGFLAARAAPTSRRATRPQAQAAMARAGSYRSDNPLEEEPSPYVGEARCQQCHPTIFRDSLASRHTQTYYRGEQLRTLPRPDRPLTDPTDPKVTHAIKEVDGALWEETRRRRHRAPLVDRVCVRDERPLPDDGQPRRTRSVSHRPALVLPHGGGSGLGSDDPRRGRPDPHRGLPGPTDQRARRGGQVPVLPHHLPARGASGSARRRPTAPSGASDATAPGRIISRRSRPASPTRRSSTPRPPRPGRSRRSSATTATSSTGTTGTTTPRTPTGSARKEWAGPGAGATPRAAGRSDASPATIPTRAPGRPRPHSTRPNASRATRPRRHRPPAGQDRWLGSQPSRDLASAPWTRQKGVSNATCPSCGWTHPTWT